MDYLKITMTLLILLGVRYIYEKLKLREEENKNLVDYDLVRKYLLNDNGLIENKKPILWVHITYDVNSREWLSFKSRNTKNLNQPYLYLTVKSIIDKCGEDFYICLIDDDTFKKLLPNWNVDLNLVSNPIKEKFRNLALAKILYNYGGLLVPNSFICFKNLLPLYQEFTKDNKMFVGEMVNRSISCSVSDFSPNTIFMGCIQNSEEMGELVNYLERLNSKDFTAQSDFNGNENEWCKNKIIENKISLINGNILGTKDKINKPIIIDNLLSNNFLEINSQAYGLYIPADELLKRTNYNWFVYLKPNEVLESETQIGKYLLISNAK